jgi:hypothetical protein
LLQRVENGIGMPYGLQLVRYGGGSDFRFVDAELHVTLERPAAACNACAAAAAAAAEAAELFASNRPVEASASFPARVLLLAMKALTAAAPAMSDIGRGDLWPDAATLCSSAYWAAAHWQLQIVASAPVPAGSRANLYFHGWLHEASRARGKGAELLQPLVGVFGAEGCVQHDGGDGDLLATGGASSA